MIEFSKIKCFIFDNDGVLVDSEKLSCQALHDLLLDEFEIDIGWNFSKVMGTSDKYSITYFLEEFNINKPIEIDYLIEKKMKIYLKLATGNLKPLDGLIEVLTYLQDNHYLLGVASSGSIDKVQFSLNQIKIREYFLSITSVTEVARGKPYPDVFFLAAKKLGANPNQCVVIEDSITGIKGVKAAGMLAIGITSTFSREALYSAGSDLVIEHYKELMKYLS